MSSSRLRLSMVLDLTCISPFCRSLHNTLLHALSRFPFSFLSLYMYNSSSFSVVLFCLPNLSFSFNDCPCTCTITIHPTRHPPLHPHPHRHVGRRHSPDHHTTHLSCPRFPCYFTRCWWFMPPSDNPLVLLVLASSPNNLALFSGPFQARDSISLLYLSPPSHFYHWDPSIALPGTCPRFLSPSLCDSWLPSARIRQGQEAIVPVCFFSSSALIVQQILYNSVTLAAPHLK
ncbi:hypothetical protein DL93DRAFT_794997 [Clavulina sp. PMI_390]|nr:hypothetical protein DL93DRAFT_794997 [Clavulina sp. PMI_390]